MKLLLFILLPFFLIAGEQNWKWINPLPQGRTIHQVIALDSLTAFACTDNGAVLRTLNGGNDWEVFESGYSSSLYSLYFKDQLNGFAAGENGLIISTHDGGVTLTKQITGIQTNLYGITSNGSRLFAVGAEGVFLFSDNNGVTWTKKDISFNGGFSSIRFINQQTGFITSSDGRILKTTNAGDTWTASTSFNQILSTVYFSDSNNGWACGQNGLILHTTDAGQQWNIVTSSLNIWFNSVSFSDNNNGVIAGKSGKFIRTTDGGVNWQVFSHDSTLEFTTVAFLNGGIGWIAGSNGLINKTTDYGNNWQFQSGGEKVELNNIKFFNADTGFVLGNKGVLYKTSDAGSSWIKIPLPRQVDLFDMTYYGFYGRKELYIAGGNGILFKSTDFGNNWDVLDFSYLTNIDFRTIGNSMYRIIAGGEQCRFLMITVYPYASSILKANYYNNVNSIFMTTNTSGYAVGQSGGIYFVNMPLVYKQGTPPPVSLLDVNFSAGDLNQIFFKGNYGWAIGKYGVLVSTKGPVTLGIKVKWQKSVVDITEGNGIYFLDTLKGFICGSDGVVLKTTNGKDWNRLNTNVNTKLNKIYFKNEQTGFVVGLNGLFMRTDNGGGSDISYAEDNSYSPEKFYLSQNYPNPFNPSTVIKFTLPENDMVTLKIYDVLGREISTLVDEYKTNGSYQVNFDGSSLSSGIYFYRLTSGKSSEIRKMLLLK